MSAGQPAPYVREIGRIETDDGAVGVEVRGGFVRITGDAELGCDNQEEFATLYVRACWEAGQNAALIAREAPSAPLSGSSRKIGREWCRVRPGVQARLLSFGGVNEDAFAWVDVRGHDDG